MWCSILESLQSFSRETGQGGLKVSWNGNVVWLGIKSQCSISAVCYRIIMSRTLSQFVVDTITQSPRTEFWYWQIGFWVFVSVVSYLSLTLWYGQTGLAYIAHTLAQAILGLALSLILYWTFKQIWHKSIRLRIVVGLVLVMFIALFWTIARVETFVIMTQEKHVWHDFGGWYFASIFIFLCWAGMFYGVKYYQLLQSEHKTMLAAEAEAKEEQIKRMRAQTVARDAQLKMLRYQLNPHFLCNTLNAINSLVESGDSQIAQKMTVQLSKFLRHSLDNNPDTKISLENEVKAINLYLEIEKIRFGERLKINFEISEDAKLGRVPSLLLQPIIENSMKHAIAQSECGGLISLLAMVENDTLVLQLSDTGSGRQVARSKIQSSKGRGVGLRNTDERLQALYENDYSIDLNLMPSGGIKTIIKIPYEPIQHSNFSRNNTVSF